MVIVSTGKCLRANNGRYLVPRCRNRSRHIQPGVSKFLADQCTSTSCDRQHQRDVDIDDLCSNLVYELKRKFNFSSVVTRTIHSFNELLEKVKDSHFLEFFAGQKPCDCCSYPATKKPDSTYIKSGEKRASGEKEYYWSHRFADAFVTKVNRQAGMMDRQRAIGQGTVVHTPKSDIYLICDRCNEYFVLRKTEALPASPPPPPPPAPRNTPYYSLQSYPPKQYRHRRQKRGWLNYFGCKSVNDCDDVDYYRSRNRGLFKRCSCSMCWCRKCPHLLNIISPEYSYPPQPQQPVANYIPNDTKISVERIEVHRGSSSSDCCCCCPCNVDKKTTFVQTKQTIKNNSNMTQTDKRKRCCKCCRKKIEGDKNHELPIKECNENYCQPTPKTCKDVYFSRVKKSPLFLEPMFKNALISDYNLDSLQIDPAPQTFYDSPSLIVNNAHPNFYELSNMLIKNPITIEKLLQTTDGLLLGDKSKNLQPMKIQGVTINPNAKFKETYQNPLIGASRIVSNVLKSFHSDRKKASVSADNSYAENLNARFNGMQLNGGDGECAGENVNFREARLRKVKFKKGQNVNESDSCGRNVVRSDNYGRNVNASESYGRNVNANDNCGRNVNTNDNCGRNVIKSENSGGNVNASDNYGRNVIASDNYGRNVIKSENSGGNVNASDNLGRNVNASGNYERNANANDNYGRNVINSDNYGRNVNASESYGRNDNENDNYGRNVNASDNYGRNANANDNHGRNVIKSDNYGRNVIKNDNYGRNVNASDNYRQNANANKNHERTMYLNEACLRNVTLSEVPQRNVHLSDVQQKNVNLSDIRQRNVNLSDIPQRNINLQDICARNVNVEDIYDRNVNNVNLKERNVNLQDRNINLQDRNVNVQDICDRNVNLQDISDRNVNVQDICDRNVNLQDIHVNLYDRNVNLQDRNVNLKNRNVNLQDRNVNLQDRNVNLQDRNVNLQDICGRNVNLQEICGRKISLHDMCGENVNLQDVFQPNANLTSCKNVRRENISLKGVYGRRVDRKNVCDGNVSMKDVHGQRADRKNFFEGNVNLKDVLEPNAYRQNIDDTHRRKQENDALRQSINFINDGLQSALKNSVRPQGNVNFKDVLQPNAYQQNVNAIDDIHRRKLGNDALRQIDFLDDGLQSALKNGVRPLRNNNDARLEKILTYFNDGSLAAGATNFDLAKASSISESDFLEVVRRKLGSDDCEEVPRLLVEAHASDGSCPGGFNRNKSNDAVGEVLENNASNCYDIKSDIKSKCYDMSNCYDIMSNCNDMSNDYEMSNDYDTSNDYENKLNYYEKSMLSADAYNRNRNNVCRGMATDCSSNTDCHSRSRAIINVSSEREISDDYKRMSTVEKRRVNDRCGEFSSDYDNNVTKGYEVMSNGFENASDSSENMSNVTENMSYVAENVTNVAGNMSNVAGSMSNVAGNMLNVAGNMSNVTGNMSNVTKNVTKNISSVTKNMSNVAGNISNVTENVTKNMSNVNENMLNSGNRIKNCRGKTNDKMNGYKRNRIDFYELKQDRKKTSDCEITSNNDIKSLGQALSNDNCQICTHYNNAMPLSMLSQTDNVETNTVASQSSTNDLSGYNTSDYDANESERSDKVKPLPKIGKRQGSITNVFKSKGYKRIKKVFRRAKPTEEKRSVGDVHCCMSIGKKNNSSSST